MKSLPYAQRQKRAAWFYQRGWKWRLAALAIVAVFTIGILLIVSLSQPSVSSQHTVQAPTPVPPVLVTHGVPTYGGPLGDFIKKYGKPTSVGAGQDNFLLHNNTLSVWYSGQRVTRLLYNIPGDASVRRMCEQFLPESAQQFNTLSEGQGNGYVDYHSSIGEIIMQLDPGQCLLFPPEGA